MSATSAVTALSESAQSTANGGVWVRATDAGSGGQLSPATLAVKRAVDIMVSLVVLLLALPVLVVTMIAIWVDTPGSPLFEQIRVGRDGEGFRLFKLRTMVSGNNDSDHHAYVTALIRGEAEQQGGMFKMAADPRVTRVGRVLRRFSIDELPQLWNVLRGDMSIVGPRPPLPYEVDLYSDRDWLRLRVKPGVTGLWQVTGRATMSFSEMVDLDIRYWESWSFRLELSILLRTPWVVVTGVGAA